jgi:hypothetical protein
MSKIPSYPPATSGTPNITDYHFRTKIGVLENPAYGLFRYPPESKVTNLALVSF